MYTNRNYGKGRAMFILALILLSVFVILSCLSVNKYKSLITLYWLVLTVLLFVADIYLSKTASYRFITNEDYQLYRLFSRVKYHVSDISRYYNICFGFFMLISLLMTVSFLRIRRIGVVLLSVPILAFVVMTDPYVSRTVFILENTTLSGIPLRAISDRSCLVLLHLYVISPLAAVAVCYLRSHIYKRRYQLLSSFIILSTTVCFFLFVFVYGTYRMLLFSNISPAKIPYLTSANTVYSLTELIIVVLMTLVLFVLVLANPFKYYDYVRKRANRLISREINNNLGMLLHTYKNAFWCITKQLQAAQSKLDAGDTEKASEYTEKTLGVAREQFESISNMLLIIKEKHISFTRVSLNECINAALGSLSVPRDIQIVYEPRGGEVFIRGSRPHITEMFVNVISNAIDALTAANKPEKIIKITSLCEDGLCLITVYDNGCGIDRRHIKKIFGLFYTTKPPATNSGIGLNYVRNVLHMHRCDMRIRSVRGEYTAVDIVFPLPKDARSFAILPQTSFFAD